MKDLPSAKIGDVILETQSAGTMIMQKQETASESSPANPDDFPSRPSSVDDFDMYGWHVSESSWEAPILIGHPHIGMGGSIMLLVMLFVNLALQLVFVYIISNYLTSIAFPQEDIDGSVLLS